MKGKWSPEAVFRNRRKRMARREYKKNPVFAVEKIKARFDIQYDHNDLFNDLPLKGGRQPKKRRGKTRYSGKKEYLSSLQMRIQLAVKANDQFEIQKLIHRFYQIQQHVTKPWQILVKLRDSDETGYYYLPSRFSQQVIQQFMDLVTKAISKGATKKDIDRIHNNYLDQFAYGG
ncbi:MAG: hypothetical protein ABJH98_17915 [Reichenbachiella sp.]|uniref:hypothetical protein n=1 Tax=Reichenbachiella sp. TaxID=2184521 RepID=UPI0032972F4D